jgi:hypothetical protein
VSHPNRQGNANAQVNWVSCYFYGHNGPPLEN